MNKLNKLRIDNKKVEAQIEQYKKWKPLIEIKEYLMILIASIPYGFVVNQVLLPHAIVGGGLTGLCEILYFATGGLMPIWLTMLVFNAALLMVAIRTVGWKFCVRSIYGVACLTMWFKLIPIATTPILTDPFMAVILAGVLNGCGLGLIFLNNGSTGGTDIIAMIVNKFRHIPMGRVLLMCDLVIISGAYFLPEVRSIEKVLYGLCYTFMVTTAVDWIMNRTRQSVQFFIFSDHSQEIARAIIDEVHRGATIIEGEGGYTGQSRKIVTVLARQHEAAKIYTLVREIDPAAFVTESRVSGVFGNGFESIKEKT